MFVLTAKLSKSKIFIAIAILVVVVAVLILIFSGGKSDVKDNAVAVSSNDDRVAFLAGFGWSVNAEPVQTQKVLIPSGTPGEVFTRYNKLQISQGYDLTKYAGKEAMRYVYEILNYPEATEPVYATILVYDGTVIGGDVTSTSADGVICGFSMPSRENS